MKYIVNKLSRIILVFVLLLSNIVNLVGIPQVFAEEDNTSAVSTSVTYADPAVTHTKSGEYTTYYLNVSVSGANTNYQEPYVDVELSKFDFEKPNNPSTAASLKNYELIEMKDKYIMRFTYTRLAGGTNVSIPFQLNLRHYRYSDKEAYPIKHTFYTDSGTQIYTNTNRFNVTTSEPSFANTLNHTYTVVRSEPTLPTVPNDYTFNVPLNTTSRPYVYYPEFGRDSRPLVLSVATPDNFVFDQALNRDWTYDDSTKTLKREIVPDPSVPTRSYLFNFVGKLKDQPFDTQVLFTYSIAYKNSDGTTQPIERKQVQNVTFKYFPLQVGLGGISKTVTPGTRFYSETNFNSELLWTLRVSLGEDTQYIPVGEKIGFDKIIDRPHTDSGLEYRAIALYTPANLKDGVYDAENLAKLSHNRVVGTLPDNSTEEIAKNVPLSTVDNKQFVNLNGKVYKKVELIFDDAILATKIDSQKHDIIALDYRTTIDAATIAKIDTWAKDLNNARNYYYVYNFASIAYKTEVSEEYRQSVFIRPSLAYVYDSYTELKTPNSGTLVYPDQKIDYKGRINIEQRSEDIKELKDGKVVILAPPGLIFNGLDLVGDTNASRGTFKLSDTYQTVYNYKNTGKTAYIYDVVDSKVYAIKEEGALLDDYKTLLGSFTATRDLTENENLTVETFFSYSNNKVFNSDLIIGKNEDVLDIDEDGDTSEKIAKSFASFIYTPPKELIVSKKSKNEGEPDEKYFSSTATDGLDILNYRIDVFNNTDLPVKNVTVIDVLPHLNDSVIVPNKEGVYAARGTEYSSTLVGPVKAPEKYTVYYTTDAPKQTLEENVALNWVLANAVTDFSKVTAIKITLNANAVIDAKTTDRMYFNVKNPSTTTVDGNRVSNNTVASYYGDNIEGAVESFKNTAILTDYVVKGKAYYDRNDDSTFNDGDVVIANREVVLYKVENGVEREVSKTTTNADGDYAFANIIEKRGDYRVKITKNPNDLLTTPLASTATDINNDLTADGYAAVTLDAQKQQGILNLALKNIFGTVNTYHQSETGETLSPSTTQVGIVNTTYNTQQATIENYTFKEVSTTLGSAATGNFIDGTVNVYYIYQRSNAGKVTVTHKDEKGATVSPQVELLGTNKLGLPYTTNPATIANYTLLETPDNATGTFTTGEQTVNYVYRRNNAGKVVVTHKDETGAVLAQQVELDGTQKLGLPYMTSAVTIENYELVTTPTNATGTFATGEQTVEYVYRRKNAGNVVVTHKDEAGAVLAPQIDLDGTQKLGLPYTTNFVTVENYTLIATPDNATGTFTTSEQTVEYVYRRNDAGKVVVTYKNENGEVLAEQVELDGTQKLGLPYETTSVTVENHTLIATPDNATGTFTTEEQTVEYVYRRNDAGKIVVTYKDENGEVLAEQVELDGTQKLDLPYETVSATVENYELVATPENATGTFTNEEQTVEYIYRRKDAGKVTVTYTDEKGNVLAPSVELDGTNQLGLPYETMGVTVENYELVALPTNATGTFTNEEQTVEYVYRRKNAEKVVVTFKDENGNVLAPSVELDGTNQLGLPYETTSAIVENYELVALPTNATGTFTTEKQTVEYVYRRKDAGKVIVTYTDENGKVLAPQVELDGKNKQGLPYDTENKVIEGYVLIAVPANKSGIFGTDVQEVRYVYRAIPKPQLPKTGQQSDFVGLGGMLLAVAYMLKRQRKQK
ncbi:MucBP domain-containing protein [Carnobacteriaceae bacterium zg-C25]|nr:MucBP domain-containing protein [Carnobacteriaceae bacterium zg-C25]